MYVLMPLVHSTNTTVSLQLYNKYYPVRVETGDLRPAIVDIFLKKWSRVSKFILS